jgi:hypothetical protein
MGERRYRTKRGNGVAVYRFDSDRLRALKAPPLVYRPSYGELADAHRQMVATMAMCMWRGDIRLNVLIEYGMLGLSLAAQPPRPSKTKKDQTVGFDPAKGKFGTYARSYAKKEMARAISGDTDRELVPEEYENKTIATMEWWQGSRRPPLPDLSWVWGLRGPRTSMPPPIRNPEGCKAWFAWLAGRSGLAHCCSTLGLLWRPPAEYGITWAVHHYKARPMRCLTAPQNRNWIKHPDTATERKNRLAYYANYRGILATFEAVVSGRVKRVQKDKDFKLPKKDKFGRRVVPPDKNSDLVEVRPKIRHVDYRGRILNFRNVPK